MKKNAKNLTKYFVSIIEFRNFELINKRNK